jgi:hypothetical protein
MKLKLIANVILSIVPLPVLVKYLVDKLEELSKLTNNKVDDRVVREIRDIMRRIELYE